MIIGITGTLGAGKGTVVDFLKEKGFRHFSVRDYLIKILNSEGKELNRENFVNLANHLRRENSPGFIVEELYKEASLSGGDVVIESIRSVGEIESLKKLGNFYLLGVDAEIRERYLRIIKRGSSTDNIIYDQFVADEEREMNSEDSSKQNLKKCIERSDFIIHNNGPVENLKNDVEEMCKKIIELEKISKMMNETDNVNVRPNWDEYFIEISRTVAKRATCDRGKSGCVIARDKQILVTGYVGSPKGLPHCDEVGHQIEATIHEDGVKRDHCIRTTHAEQNAICQAAKLGISIDGATLYCKMEPCPVCAKIIINSGIKRVVCEKKYQSSAKSLLEQAGVQVEVLNDELEKY